MPVLLQDLLRDEAWSPTPYFPSPNPLYKGPKSDLNDDHHHHHHPYQDFIAHQAGKGQPNLIYLRDELQRAANTIDAERGRTAVVEFDISNGPRLTRFRSSNDLRQYLQRAASSPMGRLYVVEDIATNYVEVLGHHLHIDPAIFATHLRTTTWETGSTASSPVRLPSAMLNQTSFSLRYPELIRFTDPSIKEKGCLFCRCNLYRQINLVRREPFYDGIGTINRKISFWSKERGNGDWDAILLVDPPVGDTVYAQSDATTTMMPVDVSNLTAHRGGYIDIIRSQYPNSREEGTSRMSLFDNIIYYRTQKTDGDDPCGTPYSSTYFARRIVLAMWVNAIEHIQKSVSQVEYAIEAARETTGTMTSRGDLDGLDWLESHLSYVYRLRRKCSQYYDWMSDNLLELGINANEASKIQTDPDHTQDWLYIRKKLEVWTTRSADAATSASGLVSLVISNKSVKEARDTRLLTILGTIYLPLSLVSGLFSMGGDFLPGKPQFGIYFAVSLPLLCLLSLAIIFIPQDAIDKILH